MRVLVKAMRGLLLRLSDGELAVVVLMRRLSMHSGRKKS